MPELGPRALYSLVRKGVVFELRLYRSLFRWVTRRPDVQGHDAEVFGYAKAVTPVMWPRARHYLEASGDLRL